MYLSAQAIQARNLAIAFVNGLITLIILLIAPLGIVAVMINTVLVTLATYLTAILSDRIVRYLQGSAAQQAELLARDLRRSRSTQLQQRESRRLQHRQPGDE